MISLLGCARRELRRGVVLVVVAVAALAFAASARAASEDLWEPLPGGAAAYGLDHAGMRAALRDAPLELSLPAPDGGFQRFRVREAPIMEPGLARRHTDIATYRGQGIDEPAAPACGSTWALGLPRVGARAGGIVVCRSRQPAGP